MTASDLIADLERRGAQFELATWRVFVYQHVPDDAIAVVLDQMPAITLELQRRALLNHQRPCVHCDAILQLEPGSVSAGPVLCSDCASGVLTFRHIVHLWRLRTGAMTAVVSFN